MKTVVKIEGMACGHCSARVLKALTELSGVSNVEISLGNGEAVFEREESVTDEAVREAVEELGFDVKSIG